MHDYSLKSTEEVIEKRPARSIIKSEKSLNNNIIEDNLGCLDHNAQSNYNCNTTFDSPFVADNNIIESNKSGNMECNLNNNYINHSHTFSFHNDEHVESNLLKLMLEIDAPNYAYKKIMNWAKDASNTGYQFNSRAGSYKCQKEKIEKHNSLD